MSNTVIRTNVNALNAHRHMKNVGAAQARASGRLASGYRINAAADDAAGLAISEKMRAQIRGLDQASRNAHDGISLIATAEGAMITINDMLIRIRELVVQAANDTNEYTGGKEEQSDRMQIQKEIDQLLDEIDQVAKRAEFNKKKLIDGSWDEVIGDSSGALGRKIYFQIGANETQGVEYNIARIDVDALSYGSDGDPDFNPDPLNPFATLEDLRYRDSLGVATGNDGIVRDSGSEISWALETVDYALYKVSSERAKLGAIQNRLEYAIVNLDNNSINLSAAQSRVKDADMGKEMANFTQQNVLQQAAISMLSQANQLPNMVLNLLP